MFVRQEHSKFKASSGLSGKVEIKGADLIFSRNPSIHHKDFCAWTKHEKTLLNFLESVFSFAREKQPIYFVVSAYRAKKNGPVSFPFIVAWKKILAVHFCHVKARSWLWNEWQFRWILDKIYQHFLCSYPFSFDFSHSVHLEKKSILVRFPHTRTCRFYFKNSLNFEKSITNKLLLIPCWGNANQDSWECKIEPASSRKEIRKKQSLDSGVFICIPN